jgi:hypothetical protein
MPYRSCALLDRLAGELQYDVPLMNGILARAYEARLLLDVELKEHGYEREVLDALAHAGWSPARFVVTSFEAAFRRA